MRLTKKLEQEVLKEYNTGWEAYMRGDLKTHASCLSSKFKIIGTTEAEHFNSKKAWLAFCKKTMHQVVGVAQLRNRKIKLDAVGDGVMVVENSAIYILLEGKWQFYSRIRITALLQKEKTGWKYVHQHGSLPDMRASEDETIATKQIKKENQQLHEAVKRRTIELEEKNRELEVEAALERVRTITMGMHKSVELRNAGNMVFQQMKALGIEAETSWLWFFNADTDALEIWTTHENKLADPVKVKASDLWTFKKEIDGWKKGKPFLKFSIPKKEARQSIKKVFDVKISSNRQVTHFHLLQIRHNYGFIGLGTWKEATEEEQQICARFAKVFEQAYSRFLDLQKAEAQTREAEIELALEKVRARTMAMQKSEELKAVIKVVYEQFVHLNILIEHAGFIIDYKECEDMNIWLTDRHEVPNQITIPYFDSPHWNSFIQAKKEGTDFFSNHFTFKEKNKFYKKLFNYIPGLSDKIKKYYFSCPGLAISTVLLDNVGLYIENFSGIPYSDEENRILMRFGKVFQQTYTRLLDLQKAEAQAREAQIEAALERVRSRSLAMHKSDELREVIQLVFEQLRQLNFNIDSAQFDLNYKESDDLNVWTAIPGQPYPTQQFIPYLKNPILDSVKQAKKNGLTFLSHVCSYKEKNEFFQHFFNHVKHVPEERKKYIFDTPGYARSVVFLDNIFLAIQNYDGIPYSEIENAVLKRFGKVFEQSYTRFLDLQKAEAHAREIEIDLALERVRAQTMAMHNSHDVGKCILKMFGELTALGVDENTRFGIGILNHDNENNQLWTARKDGEEVNMHIGNLDMNAHPLLKSARKAWKAQVPLHQYVLEGEDLLNYYRMLNAAPDYKIQIAIEKLPEREFHYGFIFEHGFFYAFSRGEFQPELIHITQRFSSLFGQTYRRYLDLVKAENQTREAQIEAALERVRGKAMAMHESADLAATIQLFYREIQVLSITPRRCGVGLVSKESRFAEISSMNTTEQGEPIEVIGTLEMTGHPVLDEIYENWLLQKEHHPVLRGNEIKDYYGLVRPHIGYPDYPNDAVQFGYFFPFTEGSFFAWTEKELKEDELKIYRRFTTVLSLTYKRYKDLKDAEVREKEAIKQATLDRVRADIASMRSTADLDRITPLIWKELTTLGIPFIRCGVFIMDESLQQIQAFLSTPDGKGIAAFHLPYDTPGRTNEILASWQRKKVYIAHWDEVAFSELGDLLVQQGALPSKDVYLKTIPQGGIHLHCLPFMQGMLYVGNTIQLKEDDIQLIQSVAGAFATAYARYEDFNKLEAAKQQVDKTLVDLKQTQQQLIQSEKMASLGELTAGIAHEIQNPLNFVNNFSEVSAELIDEMKAELATGNLELATEISDDLKKNLEKINHHGKRAGDIVKGMLQHSRAGSGKKEPTDINALCDEYLRLSYHGLRAKDKSFNATMKTDFDESLEKVDVIPQDIGRVILNLITNAFYVVNERLRQAQPDSSYEPTVTVSTKYLSPAGGGKGVVQISVKDNGYGIPETIKEKIFQPFFTTKPTGQGTGLGLSLSYDIVKAHGGELKVETKEDEGSEFIIQLPTN